MPGIPHAVMGTHSTADWRSTQNSAPLTRLSISDLFY